MLAHAKQDFSLSQLTFVWMSNGVCGGQCTGSHQEECQLKLEASGVRGGQRSDDQRHQLPSLSHLLAGSHRVSVLSSYEDPLLFSILYCNSGMEMEGNLLFWSRIIKLVLIHYLLFQFFFVSP